MTGRERWAASAMLLSALPASAWLCLALLDGSGIAWTTPEIGVASLWLPHMLAAVIVGIASGRPGYAGITTVLCLPLPLYVLFWLAGALDAAAAAIAVLVTGIAVFLMSRIANSLDGGTAHPAVGAIARSAFPAAAVTLLLAFREPITGFLMP